MAKDSPETQAIRPQSSSDTIACSASLGQEVWSEGFPGPINSATLAGGVALPTERVDRLDSLCHETVYNRGNEVVDLYREAAASTVEVYSWQANPQLVKGVDNGSTVSDSTGFAVSSDEVVTDNHSLSSDSHLQVTLPNGTRLPAVVEKRDPAHDLALVKVSLLNGELLTPLPLANQSENLPAGTKAAAFGFPNQEHKLFVSPSGILKDDGPDGGANGGLMGVGRLPVNRSSNSFVQGEDPNRPLLAFKMMTFDGNSGSPVLNEKGEVIGITAKGTAAANSQPGDVPFRSFATPVEDIHALIDSAHDVRRNSSM